MGAKLYLLIAALCLPLKHLKVTSSYGDRVHPIKRSLCFHAGVDLAARHDTVFAIADGLVESVGYDSRLGLFIKISHGALRGIYGHLSQVGVSTGDSVYCAESIGVTGATGQVTGEHLHFAITYQHFSIDPLDFLSGWYTYQFFIKQNERE